MKKKSTPRVFFNASVILAGVCSPTGGSGLLLKWAKEKKIIGSASEIVLAETVRHAEKIGKSTHELEKTATHYFPSIGPAPSIQLVTKYQSQMLDVGDAHVLASSIQVQADYLVTLDKKHLLVLAGKIKHIIILSPSELIQRLRR